MGETSETYDRAENASGVANFDNPDPTFWKKRPITSGQFSTTKKKDGPYKGARRTR